MPVRNIEKSEKHRMFNRAFGKCTEDCNKFVDADEPIPRELLLKFIYLNTKEAQYNDRPAKGAVIDEEEVNLMFAAAQYSLMALGLLTPVELERMFPINKTYDGDRWQSKDYFYTKKYSKSYHRTNQ